MLDEHDIPGEMCHYEEPDWQPLYDIVGVQLADWFMWMYEIELADGGQVHAYKHITTRRYFHLGVAGRAFVYVPRSSRGSPARYREIERLDAIDLVFVEWDELTPPPDDDDQAELTRALHAAEHQQPLDAGG